MRLESPEATDEASARHPCVGLVARDSPSLFSQAKAAIVDPSNKIWASAVSGYELVNKQRLGKLNPPSPASLRS